MFSDLLLEDLFSSGMHRVESGETFYKQNTRNHPLILGALSCKVIKKQFWVMASRRKSAKEWTGDEKNLDVHEEPGEG